MRLANHLRSVARPVSRDHMLVVVAIIGLVSAIALPSTTSMMTLQDQGATPAITTWSARQDARRRAVLAGARLPT